MSKRFVLLAFFCTALSGVATAAPLSDRASAPLLALQQMDQRVAAIGHRLARDNLDLCTRTMPLSGMLVHGLDQYSRAARPLASATFGLDEEPVLLAVVPGSAAAKAGLQPGDKIVSIAGRSYPPSFGKKASYARIQRIEEDILVSLGTGPMEVHFLREGEERKAVIAPESGCLSRVQLVPAARLNAGADGIYVQVTSGIVQFTRDDDELALVIAHEMAHNILGHREALDQQRVSRGILKSIDGGAGKIKKTEMEADYLALYLLDRAGFDIHKAPAFWDRYGRKMGPGIFSDGTHPGRSSRIEAAQVTIAEIETKKRQGRAPSPGPPLR